ARFDNPNQLLTNGNSGTIKIPVIYENAMVVPAMSTFEQQGDRFVYKITEEGKTRSTKIVVKDEVKDLVVIGEGVQSGDEIIAKGVAKVRNDMPVNPKPVPMDSVATFDTVFK
ncbi:MAG: efflux RND transporter periplasmic adaptor subunit, partial [Owenweeksia sp.]